MTKDFSIDRLAIASPCRADWNAMQGDDRVRFCGQCQRSVYNIRNLSVKEVEQLFATTEGRVCARIYRRQDGTVITRDCPVGRAALRRMVGAIVGGVLMIVVLFASSLLSAMLNAGWKQSPRSSSMHQLRWPAWLQPPCDPTAGDCVLAPPPSPPGATSQHQIEMGDVI